MGVSARIRTRDGWAVSHAVVTVTDMTGQQMLRAGADADGVVRDTTPLAPGAYTVIVTAVGYAPTASSAIVTAAGTPSGGGRTEVGTVTLARLGTGADPWGGTRAAFRATAELRREDFAMHYNQVVRAGIAAIGTTLRVEIEVQAVRGDALL